MVSVLVSSPEAKALQSRSRFWSPPMILSLLRLGLGLENENMVSQISVSGNPPTPPSCIAYPLLYTVFFTLHTVKTPLHTVFPPPSYSPSIYTEVVCPPFKYILRLSVPPKTYIYTKFVRPPPHKLYIKVVFAWEKTWDEKRKTDSEKRPKLPEEVVPT